MADMIKGLATPVEMKLKLLPVFKFMYHDVNIAGQVNKFMYHDVNIAGQVNYFSIGRLLHYRGTCVKIMNLYQTNK